MSIPPIVQPTLARPLLIDPILERDKSFCLPGLLYIMSQFSQQEGNNIKKDKNEKGGGEESKRQP